MDGGTSRRQKKVSRKQEEAIAEDIGGRAQPGSGAVHGYKGDVRSIGKIRAEAKYTTKGEYILKHEDLLKIANESGLEASVFSVWFMDDRYYRAELKLAVIPVDQPGESIYASTHAKSVKLLKNAILVRLMKLPAIYISFENRKGTEKKWYALMHWHKYVESIGGTND